MKIQRILENHWYHKPNLALSIILLPLSWLFFILAKARYYLYRFNLLKSYRLSVPVIIIGNITVGGVGKTPLTKHLAKELIASGIHVGVILRGYKGTNRNARAVNMADESSVVGDEALIYANNNIPVAIGRNRYLAGKELLKHSPDLQMILADDGMQHYRLKRDYEVAVIDERIFSNQYMLPMGPLRESTSRLRSVNAVVINSTNSAIAAEKNTRQIERSQTKLPLPRLVVKQNLVLDKIYNPITHEVATIEFLNSKKIVGIAAIGNPERFFNFIKAQRINLAHVIAFPDHHHYQTKDIPQNYDVIVTTEKDYTKLRQLNNAKIWVALVESKLDSEELLLQLKKIVTTRKI